MKGMGWWEVMMMLVMTYRWTLSPTPVTVSWILSVVDLELSGVTLSVASGQMSVRNGLE